MPAHGPYVDLWCLVKGGQNVFCVTVPMAARVAQLKEFIHRKKERGSFRQLGVNPSELDLFKVSYLHHALPCDPHGLVISGRCGSRASTSQDFWPQFQRRRQRRYLGCQSVGPRIRLLDKAAIRAPSPYLCDSTRTSPVLRSNGSGLIVAIYIDLDSPLWFLYVTLTRFLSTFLLSPHNRVQTRSSASASYSRR